MNICIFKGNLTRDVELRYTPKGSAVAACDIAVNRTWHNEAGEKQEEVSFLNCTAFGKTAETIAQYFRKGNPILLTCRAKQETWEDKTTGHKRHAIKFIVDRFEFCGESGGGKREGAEPDQPPAARPQRQAAAPQQETAPPSDYEDSVPF